MALNKKFYKAKLKTGQKSFEQVKNEFEGPEPSVKDINNWLSAYRLIDGLEILIVNSWHDDGYCLASWQENDEDAFKEFVYLIEQDSMFGSYADSREEFICDWESGEYCPSGSIVFNKNDIEIIEELKYERFGERI